MDFNELINYLKSLGDAGIVDRVNNVFTVLILYNVEEDFLQEMNNLIFTNSREDDNDIIDSINILIDNITSYLLGLVGITLNNDVLLNNKIDILEAVINIETYEDKEALVRVLEGGYNSSELFAEILKFFTVYTVEELLSYVLEISDVFNDALKRLIVENVSMVDVSNLQILHKPKLDMYKKFLDIHLTKTFDVFGNQFYNNLLTVGLPFELYLNNYPHTDKVIDNNHLAIDLLSIAILSKDSENDAHINIIRKHLSSVQPDANESSKIDTIVNKLITEINNNHG